MLHSMWDLSSLTGDWPPSLPLAPPLRIEGSESLPLDHQESPYIVSFISKNSQANNTCAGSSQTLWKRTEDFAQKIQVLPSDCGKQYKYAAAAAAAASL